MEKAKKFVNLLEEEKLDEAINVASLVERKDFSEFIREVFKQIKTSGD